MRSAAKRAFERDPWPLSGPRSIRGLRLHAADRGGFTLVELLVTVVLVSVVGVAILMLFSSLTGVFYTQGARIQNQDDARTAINQISRYIRAATSSADNMTTQSDAIALALPQEMVLYCDVDSDVNALADKVRYYLQGTTLRMQTVAPVLGSGSDPHYTYPAYTTDGILVQDAIRNGTQAVFTYYRYDGGAVVPFTPVTAADRENIVTVAISLTINERPDLAKGAVVLATDVQIRQRYERIEGGIE
jgi:prepilin-type N-terminal cleavage/methylation domain-containing protein